MNSIQTYALTRAAICLHFLCPLPLQLCCSCSERCAHTHHKRLSELLTPVGWSKISFFFRWLPWWIVVSELHWWRHFILVTHALNLEWTYSELIELTPISCSGTENSEFPILGLINSELRVRLRVYWTCFLKQGPELLQCMNCIQINFPCLSSRLKGSHIYKLGSIFFQSEFTWMHYPQRFHYQCASAATQIHTNLWKEH